MRSQRPSLRGAKRRSNPALTLRDGLLRRANALLAMTTAAFGPVPTARVFRRVHTREGASFRSRGAERIGRPPRTAARDARVRAGDSGHARLVEPPARSLLPRLRGRSQQGTRRRRPCRRRLYARQRQRRAPVAAAGDRVTHRGAPARRERAHAGGHARRRNEARGAPGRGDARAEGDRLRQRAGLPHSAGGWHGHDRSRPHRPREGRRDQARSLLLPQAAQRPHRHEISHQAARQALGPARAAAHDG